MAQKANPEPTPNRTRKRSLGALGLKSIALPTSAEADPRAQSLPMEARDVNSMVDAPLERFRLNVPLASGLV